MAHVLGNFFGGAASSQTAIPSADSDFADFAGVPDPAAEQFATAATAAGAAASTPSLLGAGRPYTKWYNVHERYTLGDFRNEGIVLLLMLVVLVGHVIGTRRNRSKAHAWMKAHASLLAGEFALVGFGRVPRAVAAAVAVAGDEGGAAEEAAALDTLAQQITTADPATLIKGTSLFEYATYASGRQNVAFVDIKLKLIKRFNPFVVIAENIVAFFIDSIPAPVDSLEAVLYPFDGKEALTVPGYASASGGGGPKSTYDPFVWAIVNKDCMKDVRDERFDVSITFTKDNAKLPAWVTVMSESGEVTEALLTPELTKAVEAAGELLEYIIISDQPLVKPTKINETAARKRIFLKYRLPSNNDYSQLLPIFTYFLHSADVLVQTAHLRPEVLRKVKSIRDDVVRQIQKADEEEKAEERAVERERARKLKRDAELKGMDAKAQKKYLEREREKEMRRSAKKSTVRA